MDEFRGRCSDSGGWRQTVVLPLRRLRKKMCSKKEVCCNGQRKEQPWLDAPFVEERAPWLRLERIKNRYVTGSHASIFHSFWRQMDFLALLFGGFIGFCLGVSVGVATLLVFSSSELRDAKEKSRQRKLEVQQAAIDQMQLIVETMKRDTERVVAEGKALRASLPPHLKEKLKKSDESCLAPGWLDEKKAAPPATEMGKQQKKQQNQSRQGYSREELLKLDPESRACS